MKTRRDRNSAITALLLALVIALVAVKFVQVASDGALSISASAGMVNGGLNER